MTHIGIDMSLTGTAIVTSPTEWRVLHNKLRGTERYAFIRDQVLADIRKHHPTHIFIEELPHGARDKGANERREMMGVLRMLAHDLELPFVEINPATLKKYATGGGKAGKPEMVSCARERFGYTGFDDNEADALLIWHAGAELLGHPAVKVPKAQSEWLRKRVEL